MGALDAFRHSGPRGPRPPSSDDGAAHLCRRGFEVACGTGHHAKAERCEDRHCVFILRAIGREASGFSVRAKWGARRNGGRTLPSRATLREYAEPPGFFADIDDEGRVALSPPASKRKREAVPSGADTCGFSLDASVRIHTGDFIGRERLCRYGARHPFSIERLSETADGRIAYKMKKPRQGKRFLIMTPLNFLRRLGYLVRHPLPRPKPSWRSLPPFSPRQHHGFPVSSGPHSSNESTTLMLSHVRAAMAASISSPFSPSPSP